MENNYCNICGRPLNDNGFCDDPECNIPNGFTPGLKSKPFEILLDEDWYKEPNWENCNNNLEEYGN